MSEVKNHLDLSDLSRYDTDDYLTQVWDLILSDISSYSNIKEFYKHHRNLFTFRTYDDHKVFDSIKLTSDQIEDKLEINNRLFEPFVKALKQLDFKLLLQEFSNNIIKQDFDWDKIFCSGGVIATLFRLNKRLDNSDIDLWIFDKEALIRTLNYFYIPNETLFVVRKNVITVIRGNINIQLIYIPDDNMTNIVLKFDLPYVKCYYDGSELCTSEECIVSWATKTLYNYKYQHNSHSRLYKSYLKGYHLDKDTYQFFNLDVPHDQLFSYLCNNQFALKYTDKFYHLMKPTDQLYKTDLAKVAKKFLTDTKSIYLTVDSLLQISLFRSEIKDVDSDVDNEYEPLISNYSIKSDGIGFNFSTDVKFQDFITVIEFKATVVFNDSHFNSSKHKSFVDVLLNDKDNKHLIHRLKYFDIYDQIAVREYESETRSYEQALCLNICDTNLVPRMKHIIHDKQYTFLVSLVYQFKRFFMTIIDFY